MQKLDESRQLSVCIVKPKIEQLVLQLNLKSLVGMKFMCHIFFGKIVRLYTAQWCVFNNYSLDKHRHQIWDHIVISVLKTDLEFCHNSPQKNKKMALFDGFHLEKNNLKNTCSFEKKNNFSHLKKK